MLLIVGVAALVAGLLFTIWRQAPFLSRLRSRRRRTPLVPAGGVKAALTPSVLQHAPSEADGAAIVVEPSALAFPVRRLSSESSSAPALEGTLRRLVGVTQAHVSPTTALAYVTYVPAEVTEAQLVEAITGAGYAVGEAADRFDWLHRRQN